jgi:hypothetical protein
MTIRPDRRRKPGCALTLLAAFCAHRSLSGAASMKRKIAAIFAADIAERADLPRKRER